MRSRLTSSVRSDLSMADRPNIGYHKAILPQETYVLFEVTIYLLIVPQFLLVLFPTSAWPFQAHKNETLPEFQIHNHHHCSHVF